MQNWVEEFNKFVPSIVVTTYMGDQATREEFHKKIGKFVKAQPAAQRKDPKLPFNVLISSYEVS